MSTTLLLLVLLLLLMLIHAVANDVPYLVNSQSMSNIIASTSMITLMLLGQDPLAYIFALCCPIPMAFL